MAKERELRDVIDQMKVHIPADQQALHGRLDALARKIPYCPPECRQGLWFMCAEVLTTSIGEPKLDWQKTVESIFSDKVPPKCWYCGSTKPANQNWVRVDTNRLSCGGPNCVAF